MHLALDKEKFIDKYFDNILSLHNYLHTAS